MSLGDTKAVILEQCIIPKSWTELVKATKKTEPTLMVHLNDLRDQQLIEKTSDGLYLTTENGVRVSFIPNMRTEIPKHKIGIEASNILIHSLGKNYNFLEKLSAQFPALVLRGIAKKDLGSYINAVGKAVRDSMIVWAPAEIEINKHVSEEINHLVAQAIKKGDITDGRIRIIIDVDLPKSLDMVIRREINPEIKKMLIENRDKIIADMVANWEDLFEVN